MARDKEQIIADYTKRIDDQKEEFKVKIQSIF